ncbi:hypothetical protein IDJ77_17245 [Mucilaginibacter sp. ZT4R22]|uniref:Uncharacterized protein n=1 Tax=Mucilaginibacter pankratovii TaxID=2772110 RepID=A0ABR7WTC5_9SPHI|nr:hypothetical protein [Mucilaginibacter pankratovii]MBD1365564.1 hypothetical protein [Mucilaginibacter pankratovii]
MPAVKNADREKSPGKVIVDNTIKSHANDPFVVKKVEDAKEALSKIKLPDYLK